MSKRQPDDLSHSLQDLGEAGVSADFAERVLAGLDQRIRRRRRRRAAGATAAGLALVALIAVGALLREQADRPPLDRSRTQAQADEIRREHSQLLEELEELRRSRELEPTVLYLGGQDDYDLVLDLNPLLDKMAGPAVAATRGQP